MHERAKRTDGGPRKTVAVLIDFMDLFGGGYELELRNALEQECRERDLDLLLVYGGALDHPDPNQAAYNAIYELIRPERVDGIITISAGLSTHVGPAGLGRLFKTAGVAARCSAGVLVPGTPSIVMDNVAGMRALMQHLIEVHGHRRLGFIGGTPGNPDAETRFAIYRESLEAAGLPYDPALVVAGDFVRRSGDLATQELLSRGTAPDAVVVANDGMALGAIAALVRAGKSIPYDIAVTGFDDLPMARLGDPPLTTVAQPLRAMMEHAVRSIAAQLNGESVAPVLHLPAELVVRDSCGCSGPQRRAAAARSTRYGIDPAAYMREHGERIAESLLQQRYMRRPGSEQDLCSLQQAVSREVSGAEPGLEVTVRRLLELIGNDDERRESLQLGLSRLRDELRPICSPLLEDIFHDAQNLIALADRRVQVQQRLEIDQAYSLLMQQGEQFSNALDYAGLSEGLRQALPTLGMHTAFFSTQPSGDGSSLEPLLCLVDGERRTAPAASFPAHRLYPEGVLDRSERHTLLAFPLIRNGRNLGVAVFQYTSGTNGYVVVRDRVSVALSGVELHQAIVRSTTLHERAIQEQHRQANEERIRALNVLAGGVAHDLNNSLGPLVALPDVMLEELGGLGGDSPKAVQNLHADLESIKSSALRAAQTIKDLLALSRQNRAPRELLDLNKALQNALAGMMGQALWAGDRVQLSLTLHREPLPLLASESHLERAISNLVFNAIEAMDEGGKLTISTRECALDGGAAERESVRIGRYAMLQVSDTGRGIPAQDLRRIFEPFFSSKRMSDRSGSGLGLAIVDGVVKDHGGFISVASTPGKGTSFTLHFPLEARELQRAQPKPAIQAGTGRILVIDDDPVQLRTATRLLQHFGYDVDAVESGARAYERLESTRGPRPGAPGVDSPYDLMIVDMELNEPEDGIQLVTRIFQLFPQQKAIISSGHAHGEQLDQGLAPRVSWLAKPYTAGSLAAAVHTALNPEHDASRAPRSSSRKGALFGVS